MEVASSAIELLIGIVESENGSPNPDPEKRRARRMVMQDQVLAVGGILMVVDLVAAGIPRSCRWRRSSSASCSTAEGAATGRRSGRCRYLGEEVGLLLRRRGGDGALARRRAPRRGGPTGGARRVARRGARGGAGGELLGAPPQACYGDRPSSRAGPKARRFGQSTHSGASGPHGAPRPRSGLLRKPQRFLRGGGRAAGGRRRRVERQGPEVSAAQHGGPLRADAESAAVADGRQQTVRQRLRVRGGPLRGFGQGPGPHLQAQLRAVPRGPRGGRSGPLPREPGVPRALHGAARLRQPDDPAAPVRRGGRGGAGAPPSVRVWARSAPASPRPSRRRQPGSLPRPRRARAEARRGPRPRGCSPS